MCTRPTDTTSQCSEDREHEPSEKQFSSNLSKGDVILASSDGGERHSELSGTGGLNLQSDIGGSSQSTCKSCDGSDTVTPLRTAGAS